MKKTTLLLPCILEDDDKIRLANDIGLLQEELTVALADIDEAKAALKLKKEDAAGLRVKQHKISQSLADGKEEREVECKVEFNVPKQGRKRIIRMDTGELVEELPMTLEERQGKLFDDDTTDRTN